jgi:hypothetical protein
MFNGHLVNYLWNLLVFPLKKDKMDGCMPGLQAKLIHLLCYSPKDIYKVDWNIQLPLTVHKDVQRPFSYLLWNLLVIPLKQVKTDGCKAGWLTNSQLTCSTSDAVYWTRNHLIWLTIVSTLTPTQRAQLIGL